jgi:hypothetical protein
MKPATAITSQLKMAAIESISICGNRGSMTIFTRTRYSTNISQTNGELEKMFLRDDVADVGRRVVVDIVSPYLKKELIR